jgi:hypothetical protein
MCERIVGESPKTGDRSPKTEDWRLETGDWRQKAKGWRLKNEFNTKLNRYLIEKIN